MVSSDLLEDQMRQALGLGDAPSGQPKNRPGRPPRTLTRVVLSVRKDEGLPFHFEHCSASMSRLVAQMEAEEAAKKQGYQVWAVLDISQQTN